MADDDASSVMSSTFSLGEPTIIKQAELDSDEEEMDEVVQGISKANLKDAPNNTKRRAGSQADETESIKTASSVSAKPEELTKEAALKRCLFCNFDSPSIESNTSHMERMHGMFIPERDYLVDLEGLIGSLFEKIYEYQECLYCGKLKSSVFGLQTHMRDKGHCKIPFHTEEEQLEIGDFYDFRSTYSDGEDDESDSESELPGKQRSGGAKLGAKRVAKDEDEVMADGEGWETDSSESTVDSDDIGSIPIENKPHTRTNGSHKHTATVYHTDYELHLPSGRTAGHRSMNKYYRQNLHNYPTEEERAHQLAIEAAKGSDDSSSEEEVDQRIARRNERERGRALASRANGGRGMLGVTAEKRKEVLAEEKRSRKTAERARRQYEWGNNKQANSQKHFRVSKHELNLGYASLLTIRRIPFSNERHVRDMFGWSIFYLHLLFAYSSTSAMAWVNLGT